MDAISFFNIWCETINDPTTKFSSRLLRWQDYWYNSSGKTGLMESEIYHEIARRINHKCSVQYYYLDAVFYDPEKDLTPNIPDNTTTLRKIRIAVEHENNFNYNLYQELSHLLLINCDLKVIISYPNNYPCVDVLEQLGKVIMREPRIEIDDNSILLIFGVRGEKDDVYWEGYTFKESTWFSIKYNNVLDRFPIGTLVDSR